MNMKPCLLLSTRDEVLDRRMFASIQDAYRVVRAATWVEVEDAMRVHAPFVAIVDVRCDEIFERLDEWATLFPETSVIAVGRDRSDRMLMLERVGLFALAHDDDDVRAWQNLIRLAKNHHAMKAEIRTIKEKADNPGAVSTPAAPPSTVRENSSIIAHVAGAFRHFEHMDLMLDRAIEGLASAMHTTRAGLFALDEMSGRYRLHAGQRYLRETADAEYEAQDPLVRWFERHAHMMTRTMAGQLQEPAQRQLLMRSLELFGAEVMAPLHARGRLLGWFFVGYRSTGQPYDLKDLEELSMAADYLSMLLENALLYREVAVQKSLAETLLHSLPTGIVATDGQGIVRWFSTAAEKMLDRKAQDVIGKNIEQLGSRLADAARRAMSGETAPPARSWEDAVSRRYLQFETRRLGAVDACEGVVVIIQDLTSMRRMQEKQEQMERTAFWTDLAAGLSHEIRNPLVTIRTFSQLLPERYQDEEFRLEFSKLVGHEVDRLGRIIDQINDFAHPPEPMRSMVDVRNSLQKALHQVFPKTGVVQVKSKLDGHLPMIQGDERALTDCFARVFQNAAEALDGKADGTVTFSAQAVNGASLEKMVRITIHDNGRGMPNDVKEKVFSPFFTTKARGMGLGLPIVKRTVIDHNGRVSVESGSPGTSVIIDLPAAEFASGGGAT